MASYFRRLARMSGRCVEFAEDESGNIAIFFGAAHCRAVACHRCCGRRRPLAACARSDRSGDRRRRAGGRSRLQVNNADKTGAVDAAKKFYTQNVTTRLPVTGDVVKFNVASDGMGITASGNALHQDAVPAFRRH